MCKLCTESDYERLAGTCNEVSRNELSSEIMKGRGTSEKGSVGRGGGGDGKEAKIVRAEEEED